MRVLRCAEDIDHEIESSQDRIVAHLLARHVRFMADNDYDSDSLTVLMIEPG